MSNFLQRNLVNLIFICKPKSCKLIPQCVPLYSNSDEAHKLYYVFIKQNRSESWPFIFQTLLSRYRRSGILWPDVANVMAFALKVDLRPGGTARLFPEKDRLANGYSIQSWHSAHQKCKISWNSTSPIRRKLQMKIDYSVLGEWLWVPSILSLYGGERRQPWSSNMEPISHGWVCVL